jgi:hypothetical protein
LDRSVIPVFTVGVFNGISFLIECILRAIPSESYVHRNPRILYAAVEISFTHRLIIITTILCVTCQQQGPVLIWRLNIGFPTWQYSQHLPERCNRKFTTGVVGSRLNKTGQNVFSMFWVSFTVVYKARCSALLRSTQTISPNMNSSNSNSKLPSPVRERRRTLMACTNCRERKLKVSEPFAIGLIPLLTLSQCRPVESVDSSPCERCIKEGGFCQYRPVDPSSTSNNHAYDYPNQDDPVILYPVHSPPPPNQEFAVPVNPPYVPTPGGYPYEIFNPPGQAPYSTPPYQPHLSSSYPVPPYPYPNTVPFQYLADQSNYQPSSQFGSHQPHPYMPYPPAHGQGTAGPYYHR